MKRAFLTIILISIFIISSVSAGDFFGLLRGVKGSGDVVTEKRDIDNFKKIKSKGSFDIIVTVGKDPSLKITFDDNLIEYIDTDVRGRTLHIDSDASFRTRSNCLIEITVPELEYVKLSGSGDIEVNELSGEYFEFDLSGSGALTAEGEIEELELRISGSGDIDTRDLKAKEVYARISGSGDIKVYAIEDFEGKVSAAAAVFTTTAIPNMPPATSQVQVELRKNKTSALSTCFFKHS